MTNKRLYNDSVKQTLDSVEITEERYYSITTTLSTKKIQPPNFICYDRIRFT